MNEQKFAVGFLDEMEKMAGTALMRVPRPKPAEPKYRPTPIRARLKRLGKFINLRGREDLLLKALRKATVKPGTHPREKFRHQHKMGLLTQRVQGARMLRNIAKVLAVLTGVPAGISVARSHLEKPERKKRTKKEE